MKHIVGIIVVNYKGLSDTLECLDSLLRIKTNHDVRLYVVNVDSPSDIAGLSKHESSPTVIEVEENVGFSKANNLGMEKALIDGAEYVVLLNNDTIVDEYFLDPLVETAKKDDAGLVSPKIYFYPGHEYYKKEYASNERGRIYWYGGGVIDWKNLHAFHYRVDEVDHGDDSELEKTDFATGCCICVDVSKIQHVGMLANEYFFGWEDTDWSWRFSQNGYVNYIQPSSKIWHKNASSSGGSGSEFHDYYHLRNRFVFGFKYAPLRTKLSLLREAHTLMRKNSKTIQKRAVFDALFHRMGKRYA